MWYFSENLHINEGRDLAEADLHNLTVKAYGSQC